jgi:Bacterial regulatory proteins, luxR family
MLHAIRIVATGDVLLAPLITRRLITEFTARPDPRERPAELDEPTNREEEILRLVAAGLSNADIARSLVISPSPPRRTRSHPRQARLPRPRPVGRAGLRNGPRLTGRSP